MICSLGSYPPAGGHWFESFLRNIFEESQAELSFFILLVGLISASRRTLGSNPFSATFLRKVKRNFPLLFSSLGSYPPAGGHWERILSPQLDERKVWRYFPFLFSSLDSYPPVGGHWERICLPVFQFIFHYLYVHCLCAEKYSFR